MARLPLRYLLLSDVSRVSIFPFLFFFPFFHTFYSRSVFLATSRSAIAAFKFLRSRYKKKKKKQAWKREQVQKIQIENTKQADVSIRLWRDPVLYRKWRSKGVPSLHGLRFSTQDCCLIPFLLYLARRSLVFFLFRSAWHSAAWLSKASFSQCRLSRLQQWACSRFCI